MRASFDKVVWYPWLHMDQEEEHRPYTQLPSDDMDLWVTDQMMKLGFQENQIQDTLKK